MYLRLRKASFFHPYLAPVVVVAPENTSPSPGGWMAGAAQSAILSVIDSLAGRSAHASPASPCPRSAVP